MVEFYLWTAASLIVGGRVIFVVVTSRPYEAPMIIREYYFEFALTTLVFVFPIVFKLIFGALPLEHLRNQRDSRLQSKANPEVGSGPSETSPTNTEASTTVALQFKLLHSYALESRQLAKGIYGRAGVYLLVGVLVAFSGLVFFYAQTPSVVPTGDSYSLLIGLAPKFGILFFIEFVAFFFLKQYRSAMDEFRYYDGIARVREEVLTLLQVSFSNGKAVSPMDLVKYDSFFSRSGVLNKGQTTEILEARRIDSNDLDVIQKALDVAVSKSKK
jgi:hypothetical protein